MNRTLLLGIALCALFVFSSCGSKKSAYKNAYEQAQPGSDNGLDDFSDDDLGNGDGEEIPPVNKPKDDGGFADSNANEGGNYDDYSSYDDSYKPIEEPLYPYDGGDVKVSFNLKRYNVVIGTFRNSTNAKALKERMQRDGYVVDFARNDKGLIRVIVKSTDNRAEALKERAKVRSKYYPNFQDTWVLKRY